jgi:hypothetical protein
VSPWKVVRSLPLSASQSRAVLSPDAVSTRRPSGLKTALTTESVSPWKVVRSLPLSASQSRAVLSPGAVAPDATQEKGFWLWLESLKRGEEPGGAWLPKVIHTEHALSENAGR